MTLVCMNMCVGVMPCSGLENSQSHFIHPVYKDLENKLVNTNDKTYICEYISI